MLGFTGTLGIAPSLYPNAGYDSRKDFAPVGRIGMAPNSLVVHPSFPVRSVAELIAYAKQKEDQLWYAPIPVLAAAAFVSLTGFFHTS